MGDLADAANVLPAGEVDKVRKERDAWKKKASDTAVELEQANRRLAVHERLAHAPISAPGWAKRRVTKQRQATALGLLSDLHLDEVVRPEEMLGLNAYNREIALLRLRKFTEGSVLMARDYLSGFNYDGAVLLFGGDTFSGAIHEELKETNEAPVLASLEWWLDPLASVVQTWADEFGKLLCVCVVGNHPRLAKKWRYKGAVEDNLEWFLYRQLVRYFKDDKRITWNVPLSVDAYFDVYGHRHLLTHGNQARGGSGISGLLTPLSLLDHRKRKRDATTLGAASHMWMGHWHQLMTMGSVTVNGSLKGYDEYAFGNNFPYEDPQQAFALITPEHNVTIQTPIYCMDRDVEGW